MNTFISVLRFGISLILFQDGLCLPKLMTSTKLEYPNNRNDANVVGLKDIGRLGEMEKDLTEIGEKSGIVGLYNLGSLSQRGGETADMPAQQYKAVHEPVELLTSQLENVPVEVSVRNGVRDVFDSHLNKVGDLATDVGSGVLEEPARNYVRDYPGRRNVSIPNLNLSTSDIELGLKVVNGLSQMRRRLGSFAQIGGQAAVIPIQEARSFNNSMRYLTSPLKVVPVLGAIRNAAHEIADGSLNTAQGVVTGSSSKLSQVLKNPRRILSFI